MRRAEFKAFVTAMALSAAISLPAPAGERDQQGSWISTWSAAVHSPLPFPGLPQTPVFENQTVRMVVRTTIGGQQIRLRFSNACGTLPLEISSAHVALTAHDAKIVADTDRAITFDGRPSVKIPAGAPILSDPITINIPAFAELSVSIYLPHSTSASTTHFWAQHASYVSGPGDFSAKVDISPAARPHPGIFLPMSKCGPRIGRRGYSRSETRSPMGLEQSKGPTKIGPISWRSVFPSPREVCRSPS